MPGSQVVNYGVGDGQVVAVEVVPVEGFVPVGADDVAGRVMQAARPALSAAAEVLRQARELAPDTVQVKFGLKVTGTANWLVAKAATEGNFEVTMTWGAPAAAG